MVNSGGAFGRGAWAASATSTGERMISRREWLNLSLGASALTYNDAHRVLPFDNALMRVRVSGLQLRRIAEVAVGQRRPDDFSGIVIDYDTARPPGSRVLSMVLDDGTPIDEARAYTLVVPEYIADGGGGYGLFTELPTERLDIPMLDAFIEHLRAFPQPIVAPAERRARPRSPSGQSAQLETVRTPLTHSTHDERTARNWFRTRVWSEQGAQRTPVTRIR